MLTEVFLKIDTSHSAQSVHSLDNDWLTKFYLHHYKTAVTTNTECIVSTGNLIKRVQAFLIKLFQRKEFCNNYGIARR